MANPRHGTIVLASPSCPGCEPPEEEGRFLGLSPRGSSDRDWGSAREDGRGVRRARGRGLPTPVGMDGRRPCVSLVSPRGEGGRGPEEEEPFERRERAIAVNRIIVQLL